MLSSAVAAGDAETAVDAVRHLLGEPVRLLDGGDNSLADGSCAPVRPLHYGRSAGHRELILREGASVLGSWELPGDSTTAYDGLINDFGLLLLHRRQEADIRRNLQHRLALLDCVCPSTELTGFVRSCTDAGAEGRFRPVVLSARRPLDGGYGRRILTRLLDYRRRDPVLDELRLVLHDGLLAGAVPDGDQRPSAHTTAWSRLLRSLLLQDQLRVTVGQPSEAGPQLREQFSASLRVARLQQENSPYFELPPVAISEELGPIADVLLDAIDGNVTPFIERVLGDLLTDQRFDGQLIETLHVYLRTDGSVREAAARLHLHPSSVKYRVGVLREMVGRQLEDREQRFELELAASIHLAIRQLSGAAATNGRTGSGG